jgi:hypothetical protein
MSDKRELPNIETSKDVNMPVSNKDEPGLPVKIPLSIIRWLLYSFAFMLLLTPIVSGTNHDGPKAACGGLILGWFASLLNAIASKKEGP